MTMVFKHWIFFNTISLLLMAKNDFCSSSEIWSEFFDTHNMINNNIHQLPQFHNWNLFHLLQLDAKSWQL